MKLDQPENANYAAVVVQIKSITPLKGCDNVVGTPLLGFQAIVSKDTKIGDIGIIFPAECQLSTEYSSENNLYRHGDRNRDESAKGYLEDNSRIKAMKFRGHRSDCLFMPLESLAYTGAKLDELKEGDTFDKINGHEICKKYQVVLTRREATLQKNKEKFVRVDKAFLPEHYDSDNFFRNYHVVPEDTRVVVTQKLHGTSIRVGNTIVARNLSLPERLLRRLGVKVAETEFDYVFGSRKVIKDINNPNQNHYYATDIWTSEGRKLEGLVPENYLVYGELIGWTPDGAPIQKGYTYNVPEKTCDLYIYRVAFVNGQGKVVDLAWEQVKEFCRDAGLKYVPELWVGIMRDLAEIHINNFLDKNFVEQGYTWAVPLAKESPCDEGVCVRVDGMAPYILKAKSPMFLQHESKMLDTGEADLESQESIDALA